MAGCRRRVVPLCRASALSIVLASTMWADARGQDRVVPSVGQAAEVQVAPTAVQAPEALAATGTITRIVLEGLTTIEEKDVLSKLKSRKGREMDGPTVDSDVQSLVKTGWFSDIRPSTKKDPDRPGVILIFALTEAPILRQVEFRGMTRLKIKDVEQTTGVKKDARADYVRSILAASSIQRMYEEKGYEQAQVRLVEGGTPNSTKAIYEIVEGPRTRGPRDDLAPNFPRPLSMAELQPPGLKGLVRASVPSLEDQANRLAYEADEAIGQKRFDDAIARLDSLLELAKNDKSRAWALSRRAWAKLMAKRRDEAIPDAEEAVRLDPEEFMNLMILGEILRDAKRWDVALSTFDRAIRCQPERPDGYLGRGAVLLAKQDFRSALSAFDEAERLGSRSPFLFQGRGYWLARLNDHRRAVEQFGECLAAGFPDRARALEDRGKSYSALRDYDAALADFNEALRIAPDRATTREARGKTYTARGEYDRAIEDFTAAILAGGDLAFASYFNRGNAFMQKGQDREAIADMEQALKLKPQNGLAAMFRAYLLTRVGRIEEGERELKKAILADPQLILGELMLMERSLRPDEPKARRKMVDDLVARHPESGHAHMVRGLMLNDTENLAEALASLNRAVQLRPGDPQVFLSRASVRVNAEDWAGAIADATEAIRLDPVDPLGYSIRAKAFESRKDRPRALADYGRAIEHLGSLTRPGGPVPVASIQPVKTSFGEFNGYVGLKMAAAQPFYSRAELSLDGNDLQSALKDADSAVRLSPEDAGWPYGCHLLRARVHKARGDRKAAIADATEALKLAADPEDREEPETLLRELGAPTK